eukprot:g2737.t1
MDLLRAEYASTDEEDEGNICDSTGGGEKTKHTNKTTTDSFLRPDQMRAKILGTVVNAAPSVISATTRNQLSLYESSSKVHELRPGQVICYNPTAAEMYRPPIGPENPFRKKQVYGSDGKIALAGVAESHSVDGAAFERELHEHQHRGYAAPPRSLHLGGEVDKWKNDPRAKPPKKKRKRLSKSQICAKEANFRERVRDSDASAGPWAAHDDAALVPKSDLEAGTMTEAQKEARRDALIAAGREDELDEEAMNRVEAFKYTRGEGPKVRWSKGIAANKVKTIFHGDVEADYQGRSWVDPPPRSKSSDDLDDDIDKRAAFVPKKCIHTWSGHTKGVRKIDLFPKYGHLLLSGSFDSKVKIWNVHDKRHCMRTYMGHSEGVNDVSFSNDGDCFISSSLDRHIKLWDTETGKCRIDMSNNKVPYCAKFYPQNNNLVLVGCSNKKCVQFDCRTGEVAQEYDHHLGPVNSVLFIDNDRRFVTTSDDKKMLIWDFNVPVPIKYISDPAMQSIPALAQHPNGKFFVGQSLDNQILSYQCGTRIKPYKKRFDGHVIAGYACQPNFSPNGRFLMSGDGDGRLWFWDWKSTAVYRKLRAHSDGPCIDCRWHPTEPSKVVTCGWDGLIKLWA